MDSNNSNFSEIKMKRERFSIEMRRLAQSKLFARSRKHLMSEQNNFIQAPDKHELEINPIRQEFFEKAKKDLIDAFNARNNYELLNTISRIRHEISENSNVETNSFREFFDSDLPAVLFEVIKNEAIFSEQCILSEVLWIFGNASASPSDKIDRLITLGILELIRQVLSNPDKALTEHVLFILSNILGESPHYKKYIDNDDIWPMVFVTIDRLSMYPSISKAGCWLYSNALRGPPYSSRVLVT